jgi:hypothetical protein
MTLILRSALARVSKDAGPIAALRFETALTRLLTMRRCMGPRVKKEGPQTAGPSENQSC